MHQNYAKPSATKHAIMCPLKAVRIISRRCKSTLYFLGFLLSSSLFSHSMNIKETKGPVFVSPGLCQDLEGCGKWL